VIIGFPWPSLAGGAIRSSQLHTQAAGVMAWALERLGALARLENAHCGIGSTRRSGSAHTGAASSLPEPVKSVVKAHIGSSSFGKVPMW